MSDEIQNDNQEDSLSAEIDERLRSIKSPTERRTIAGLLRETGSLPLHQAANESAPIRIPGVCASDDPVRVYGRGNISQRALTR